MITLLYTLIIGRWNGTTRAPDVLVVQVGLHTCVHSWFSSTSQNKSMIHKHKDDLKLLMNAINIAIHRYPNPNKTMVIIQTAGRVGNKDPIQDQCTWEFNRVAAYEAHIHGFAVFDRGNMNKSILILSIY